MLMSRCGLDTEGYFEREDFAGITDFNTPATLNAIGIATSDIAGNGTQEISSPSEMCKWRRKPKPHLCTAAQSRYDVDRTPTERSDNNERNHLQQTGGITLFPDLTLPTEPEIPLGRYAMMQGIIWSSTRE